VSRQLGLAPKSAVGRRAPCHVAVGRQSQSSGGGRRQSGQRFGSKPKPQNFFWRLRRIETLSLRRCAAASACHELVCGCRRRHVGCRRVPVCRTNDMDHQRSDCASSSLARDDVANVMPVRLAPKFIFGRRRRPLLIPRWRQNFHLFQPGKKRDPYTYFLVGTLLGSPLRSQNLESGQHPRKFTRVWSQRSR
jgi:hypothetical protein